MKNKENVECLFDTAKYKDDMGKERDSLQAQQRLAYDTHWKENIYFVGSGK